MSAQVRFNWADADNTYEVLKDAERLFCNDLASIDISSYDPDALLFVASRPDLTPIAGSQLIEQAVYDEDILLVLAQNSRTPIETLIAVAGICSRYAAAHALLGNPSVVDNSDTLDRIQARLILNPNIRTV